MELEHFNKKNREQFLTKAGTQAFDLAIIGGGITGGSIFLDAVLRGMRVVLFEAHDFASGTSSRSSKLIHGGLRYIKALGFGVARESCTERNLHMRLNKRLVWPMPFLIPLYSDRGFSKSSLALAMWVYEILSSFSNYRMHRFISREETLLSAPGIDSKNLIGGCVYYDAAVNDSRLTIEIIKEGVRHEGIALNYTPVTGFIKEQGKIIGVTVKDSFTNKPQSVKATVVVNATGAFTDKIRELDKKNQKPLIRLSKGTHLVFAAEDVPLSMTTLFESALDGRPLFLSKINGSFLLGPTDDWEDTEPDKPIPKEKDVAYLLDSLARFMPEANLDASKIKFVYSGFRPLLRPRDKTTRSDHASRTDFIEMSESGLITIVGGKLTTARRMALKTLALATKKLANRYKPSETYKHSIGGTNQAIAEALSYWVKRCPQLTQYFTTLFMRYGLDAAHICREALEIYAGKHPDKNAELMRAEVEYVCRHEMACTLEDLIERRAGFLQWDNQTRIDLLKQGKQILCTELAMEPKEFEKELADYKKYLEKFHSAGK